MTRKEIENYIDDKKQYGLGSGLKGLSVADVGGLIDKIFDDIEKQTCENCKWYEHDCCMNKESISYGYQTYDDYGCNRWEEK